MVHNHNTESELSLPDLQELVMWENLDIIAAVTNNGITTTVDSNGKKTEEPLFMEFESVGRDSFGHLTKESNMVEAAIKVYARGKYKYDGRKR